MLRKTLYPKTTRIKVRDEVTITEKIDGSNLGIFKKDDDLIIATRDNIIRLSEINDPEAKQNLSYYNGLLPWLEEHGQDLIDRLYDGSGYFGEWLTKSPLAYPMGMIGQRWFIFAKARITDDYSAERISYDHDLLKYPFIDEMIPDYIQIVPVVTRTSKVPSVEELNVIYDEYTEKVGRKVEGFVISYYDTVRKYVRMKRGKLEDHFE